MFFALQVYQTLDGLVDWIIFIGAIVFVTLPIFSNFIQLHQNLQVWVTDLETRVIVQAWIQMHLRTLYLLSIVFGSAFTAVELCNSNIFHLNVFNMGLNRRQKAAFKNKRLFSTVLLENVPQVCRNNTT